MTPQQIAQIAEMIQSAIREHAHEGVTSPRINFFDIFGNVPADIPVRPATIATTGNTDDYVVCPIDGTLSSVDFSSVDALAASDTNYITFTITNLGQDGSGSTVMFSTSPTGINTTKATGGTAIAANTKYPLTLSVATHACVVKAGDRLRIRAAVTGTLANTVTFPTYMLRFI